MRKIATLTALAALLALVGGSMTATSALARTKTRTFHVHNETETSKDRNPCTGDKGTLTLTYNAVFHVTKIGPGQKHVTFTQTGRFQFVPNDPSKPSYTGHFTAWGGFNTNGENQTGTFTFSVKGKGSDGSTLRFHEVMHITVGANGVKVEFDKVRCG